MVHIVKEKFEQAKNLNNFNYIIFSSIAGQNLYALKFFSQFEKARNTLDKQTLFNAIEQLVRDDKNKDIVQYAIENLKLNYTKEKGANGNTLLLTAVRYNAIETTKLLLKNNFKLDIKDFEGKTALHYAVMNRNLNIVKILLENGANANIIDINGLTPIFYNAFNFQHKDFTNIEVILSSKTLSNLLPNYTKFKNSVTEGTITTELGIVKGLPKIIECPYYYKALTYFNLALYDDKSTETYIKLSIANYKIILEKDYSQELKHNTLSLLFLIYSIFKDKNSKELYNYILNKIQELNFPDLRATFLNELLIEKLHTEETDNLFKIAEQCEDVLLSSSDIISEEKKYEMNYNLGLFWRNYHPHKALDHFKKALTFSPNDQDIIFQEIQLYSRLNNAKEVLLNIKKIKDVQLKNLLLIDWYLEICNTKEYEKLIKKINFAHIDSIKHKNITLSACYHNIKFKTLFQENKFSEAIDLLMQHAQILPSHELAGLLQSMLINCNKYQAWKIGLDLINNYYNKYPSVSENKNIELKALEYKFFIISGALDKALLRVESILEILNLPNVDLKYINQNITFCILNAISYKHYNLAEKIINHTKANLNFNINDKALEKILKLFDSLKKEELTLKDEHLASEVNDEPKQPLEQQHTELANNLYEIAWTEDEALDEILKTCDPKIIHKYFQEKSYELETKIFNTYTINGWNTPLGQFNISDTYNIEQKEDFYAVIENSIANKLGEKLHAFELALKKGMVSKSYKSIGIKYIPGHIFKLVINGDDRLYTENVFKNAKGQYLIVLDKHALHPELKKITNSLKCTVIECGNSSNTEPYNLEKSGEDICNDIFKENYISKEDDVHYEHNSTNFENFETDIIGN